jgi:denticleless
MIRLACAGGDEHISVYDVEKQKRTHLLKGHTESIKSLSAQPNSNNQVLASASRDGSLIIFDLRCNKTQFTIQNPIEYSNCDSDTLLVRHVNQIQKAHFELNDQQKQQRGALKSKHLNQQQQLANNRKHLPLSSLIYHTENQLISAAATDELIKVWDTRKIYSINHHSAKHNHQQLEPRPLYTFDQSTMIPTSGKKGFSNLLLNSSKTRLYSNCMNNYIYEYNLLTYKQSHTRTVNRQPFALAKSQLKSQPYHLNGSNFIKSCLSPCDQFILCGSSNSIAYIYSTNQNFNKSRLFRMKMPIIQLKGHTNEVTTVAWNPFDSNQVITCSDDNTIRCWNVKQEIDEIETKETNFFKVKHNFNFYFY